MPDTKITTLPELITVDSADIVPIVDDPTGTPITKKITIANLTALKANATHTHAISDTTGLQTAIDGKAASSHTHNASDVNAGTVATARLGSGTANSSTYLRGDQTWATPAGGSGQLVVAVHADAGVSLTLTNQANAEQFLGNANRNITKVDLTNYTQVRLITRVVTASASANSPRVYAEYNTTGSLTVGTYSDIGTSAVSCSLSTTGIIDSGWVDLVSGAKADVFVIVIQNGGDAAADPALGGVYLHFR